jgi:hypothetical protein
MGATVERGNTSASGVLLLLASVQLAQAVSVSPQDIMEIPPLGRGAIRSPVEDKASTHFSVSYARIPFLDLLKDWKCERLVEKKVIRDKKPSERLGEYVS